MGRIKINDIDIERELTDEELKDVFGGDGSYVYLHPYHYMPAHYILNNSDVARRWIPWRLNKLGVS